MLQTIAFCCAFVLLSSCNFEVRRSDEGMIVSVDSSFAFDSTGRTDSNKKDKTIHQAPILHPGRSIDTKNVNAHQLVNFAESLVGIPYRYGSTDPARGFDCSGFITYVFNHFNIAVPRSSIDFTNVGKPVSEEAAQRGDIILFTGTDSTEHFVGHMGIVVSTSDTLKFIHSSSGKAMGVTITPFNNYYRSRFVKIVRVFNDGSRT